MNAESLPLWYWFIPLLAGLLLAYVGFLIGKGSGRNLPPPAAMTQLEKENETLRTELRACLEKQTEHEGLREMATIPFDARAAREAFGKRIREDDLKLVEGIGPKIEGLFHNFDIKTWKALSETSVAKCQEVLDSGGDRYLVHDPASWPMQARMAYEGKWKALARWQEEHKHGKL